MPATYAFALLRNTPEPEWSRFAPYDSDAQAIAAARRIAEAEGRRSVAPLSLMIGRSAEEGGVTWLGGWEWPCEGALCWEPEAGQALS
jgi:hypothetical protein